MSAAVLMPPTIDSTAATPEGAAASDAAPLVHSPVLDQLEDFFSDPEFTSAINDFASTHAPAIQPLAEGAEHPLEYHTAFMAYTKLIEDKVTAFITDHGFSEDDIVVAALHAPPGVHTCIDYLIASTEYTAFLQLMADFNSLGEYADDS